MSSWMLLMMISRLISISLVFHQDDFSSPELTETKPAMPRTCTRLKGLKFLPLVFVRMFEAKNKKKLREKKSKALHESRTSREYGRTNPRAGKPKWFWSSPGCLDRPLSKKNHERRFVSQKGKFLDARSWGPRQSLKQVKIAVAIAT